MSTWDLCQCLHVFVGPGVSLCCLPPCIAGQLNKNITCWAQIKTHLSVSQEDVNYLTWKLGREIWLTVVGDVPVEEKEGEGRREGGGTRWAGVARIQGKLVWRKEVLKIKCVKREKGDERGVRHSRGNMGAVSDRGFCMKRRKSIGGKRRKQKGPVRQLLSEAKRVGEGMTRSDNRQRGRRGQQREQLQKHMIGRRCQILSARTHTKTRTHSVPLSLSPPHISDKSQSFSGRFQPVNLTHPTSPCLTLPHGPPQGAERGLESQKQHV